MGDSKRKIAKLEAILEASNLLNTSKDTTYILNFLLKKSLDLIDGGDIGVILLYNEHTKMLELKASVGFDFFDISIVPGESMTGITFLKQKTIFFSNQEEVKEAMNTLSHKNRQKMERCLQRNLNELQSSIACPLIYKEKCIGVIVIDNFQKDTPITEYDSYLLKAISIHAAIAIINARNYEKELQNKNDLEMYSKILEAERNKYRYAAGIHNKFTKMVLDGNNIQDVLHEISSILNKDVFIIDRFYNINYSSCGRYTKLKTILGISFEFINNLIDNKKSKYYKHDFNLQLDFFPIMVKKETLGWFGVVSDNNIYSPLDNIVLEKATTILALELLKINELNHMEQSLKGDFLDQLILNQNVDDIKKYAKSYRFNLDKKHQMIIFEIKNNESNKNGNEFKDQIEYYYNIISKKVINAFSNSITFIKGHNIIVIIEVINNNKYVIRTFLENIMDVNVNMSINLYKNLKIRVGVSDIIDGINEFRTAYYNILQIMKMAKKINLKKNYYFYDDLEITKFLLNNDKKDLEKFLIKTLKPLINYEKNSENQFMDTFKMYIKSNGNWTYTKNKLHIHGNTLNYRLNRIKEILDIDLNNYYDRLKIQIAFEILDILQ
ncbi:helix-turn-helix domain-containing protein [Haloimpatiens sp. FM7330]|uniref:helix-turn-helix domain-containing protein n=1 Tax=Haloimpatiens sp. FM7330 TaxID=3298610 RepID=UPI00364259AA